MTSHITKRPEEYKITLPSKYNLMDAVKNNEVLTISIKSDSFIMESECLARSLSEYKNETKLELVEIKRVKMPEQKRYCLKIQYPVREECITAAYLLAPVYDDGTEIKPYFQDDQLTALVYIGDNALQIPSSWLVEIKETRPCTSGEYADACESLLPTIHTKENRTVRIEAFDAGVEATELKHCETESFEDYFESEWQSPVPRTETHSLKDLFSLVWKASRKSIGYE